MVAKLTKKFSVIFLVALIISGLAFVSVGSVLPGKAETYGSLSMSSNNLGGRLDDGGYCIKLTSENGLIMAGYTKSLGAGGSDLWLINTAPAPYTMSNGVTGAFQKEQWNKTYGGERDDGAYSVIETSGGGYAAAGFTSSFGAGGNDMWLIKTAVNGNLEWKMTYGGVYDDVARCLIQTSDGGYLLAGYTNSGVPSQSSYIVKTDVAGNIVWSKVLSGSSANSVVKTSDGAYALAIEYSNVFGLIKVDSSGNILLNQTYAGPSNQASTQAIVQTDDGYTIAGSTTEIGGSRGTCLVKTDLAGKMLWSQNFPNLGAYSLIKTAEGGYALTGDRAFLIITDSMGNVQWSHIYDGNPENSTDYQKKYPVIMQSIIEASPNHFVMVGFENGGPYVNLQLNWIQVALKSGAQTIPPQTTILSPTNTVYSQRNVPLTFYVNEPTINFMCSINSANFTIGGNKTLLNLPDGTYAVTVFSMDTDHNLAPSQTISFEVKSYEPIVLPKVVIQSPTNQVYNATQIRLNFSVNQEVLWTAYNLDGGVNRTVFPSSFLLQLPNGTHTLTVYAGQLPEGQAGSATVNFTVSAPATPYPYSDTRVTQLINQLFEEVFAFFTSTTFLVIAASFIAVAFALVVAVLLISRRATKEKDPLTYSE
jgi:hypothetical protein